MIEGKLKSTDGNVIATFPVPQTLYELPLNRYIDFVKELDKQDDDGRNAIACISRAVSCFYDINLEAVLSAQFAEGDTVAMDSHLMVVKQMYGNAAGLIDKHIAEMTRTPKINVENQQFDFCGQTFTIPTIGVRALSNGSIESILPPLSTIETIEAAEVHRIADQLITDNDDPDGNYLYAKHLKTCAVFCRKPGQNMPIDDREREQFILSQADFFGGNNPQKEIISAGTALDIDFFLTPFSGRYANQNTVVGFLFRRSLALVLEALLKPRALPAKNRNAKNTRKRSSVESGGGAWSRNYLKKVTLKRRAAIEQN